MDTVTSLRDKMRARLGDLRSKSEAAFKAGLVDLHLDYQQLIAKVVKDLDNLNNSKLIYNDEDYWKP